MRYLLLLFLAGCASSPRRHEFHDGPPVRAAPVFVAPGYTPAGAGLPEYMPAAEAPAVERSPHRRVLPETPSSRREPGLWAGDEPRAVKREDPDSREVSVLGIPLPSWRVKSTNATRVCATDLDSHVDESRLRKGLMTYQVGDLRCFVLASLTECLEFHGRKAEKKLKAGDETQRSRRDDFLRAWNVVDKKREAACREAELDDFMWDAASIMHDAFKGDGQ